MSIIGSRLPAKDISPISLLRIVYAHFLCGYKYLHEIMLKIKQQNGLIWTTNFAWNKDLTSIDVYKADWLKVIFTLPLLKITAAQNTHQTL